MLKIEWNVGHEQAVPAEESELLPLSPVRLLIAQRMLNSFTSIPHIYLDEATGSRFLQQFKAFLEDPYLLV